MSERDPDCLFCKIAGGEVPADIVAQDEHVMAFRDISPKAPTHVLLIPRRHIPSAAQLTADDGA
ncbi:MAG TPA: HIT domain-containing protein, partial [Candidatus Limnocylindrales bacterium]